MKNHMVNKHYSIKHLILVQKDSGLEHMYKELFFLNKEKRRRVSF